MKKMIRMAPINIVFYLAIFTNGKVLQYSTVETFIAFRSLTPLLVSGLDTIVRGESPPSFRTMLTLVAIAAGAGSYAYDDVNFSVTGYTWAIAYLIIIVTEMVYAKHVTSTIGLSTWGLVLYQNTIAMFLFPFASVITGEMADIYRLFFSIRKSLPGDELPALSQVESSHYLDTLFPLFVSCVLGLGISFSAWGTRTAISATQFTVLGVACKLATVGINAVVWSHHAPLIAQISIIMCIIASVLYQQSAKRDKELYKLQKFPINASSSTGVSIGGKKEIP
mmetsp:Transcript_14131/g.17072  ORF Transcript_14131/g.17072 Transcript_14131/m.17072 type:complete len:280 (+) Transcript_14131:1-840(+)